ncbi:MAG: hypothetical protein ACRC5T_10270 [Cetobacterium sp.]
MKIIFMCPNYYNYGEKISELIIEYTKAEVMYISHFDYKYSYKNILEKLYNNLILKPFFKTSLKKIKEEEELIKKIDSFGKVDLIVTIRPDFFSEKTIKHLKSKGSPMKLHFWDSISYIPEQEKYMIHYNKKSTFDKDEAEKYNMEFLPNFYFEDKIQNNKENIEYDVFTVMSYDERFSDLEKLAKKLNENGWKYKFIVVTKENIKSDFLEIRKIPINFEQSYEILMKSRCFLDIGHHEEKKIQNGLSLRVMEALGKKKKLITTNKKIKEYDFYNENNIFVLENNNHEFLEYFLKKNYVDLELEVYEKYSIKNWIKKLID